MRTERYRRGVSNVTADPIDLPQQAKLGLPAELDHAPRRLILYGSLRPQSYSRKLALETERILRRFGAEPREFDDGGRMKPTAHYDRLLDVMEELVKFTLLVGGGSDYLVDRYSERQRAAGARD